MLDCWKLDSLKGSLRLAWDLAEIVEVEEQEVELQEDQVLVGLVQDRRRHLARCLESLQAYVPVACPQSRDRERCSQQR